MLLALRRNDLARHGSKVVSVITIVVSSLVSSTVGAIVAAIISKIKLVRKASDDAKQSNKELMELMQQNILMTCRMAIYDEHFSVDEKLDAYAIYRDNGGNHQTKTYMDKLVNCDVDEYLEKHRKA